MGPCTILLPFLFCAAVSAGAGTEPPTPTLTIESPSSFRSLSSRLERIDPARLRRVMSMVGTVDPGDPVRVILAARRSELASTTPPWVGGYALSERSAVILFPARLPSYPDSSLEEVLLHELCHIFIARAAGHRPVPRWFNEGLAMIAGSPWSFGDRSRLTQAMLVNRQMPLTELDQRFAGGRGDIRQAYALAGAFTRDLLQRHGNKTAGAILQGLARDLSFAQAFRGATGVSIAQAERSFWRRYAFWYRWMPVLTSTTTLWIGITTLALLAMRRRRARDAQRRQRWLEEELETQPVDDELVH